MITPYDALVFIGRFSPFHLGHAAVVDEALRKSKMVVILVGSSYASRNIRNPFTFEERKAMIKACYPRERVIVAPLPDFPYDDNKWVKAVQSTVEAHVTSYLAMNYDDFKGVSYDNAKIGLIGHNKDHTSYYLKMFPKWGSVEVENYMGLNATDIRDVLLRGFIPEREGRLPHPVANWLGEFRKTQTYAKLVNEFTLIQRYKASWEGAPYPPTFVTVDAVVVQSGHVLLVKRKESPGIGLKALPGGFLNQNETLLEGAIRELKEETKIKVPIPVLKGSIKSQHTFDSPHRSSRGRTITTAFFIDLGFDLELPKVTGADDAEKAMWVPLNEVRMEEMFEDHFFIMDYFLNLA